MSQLESHAAVVLHGALAEPAQLWDNGKAIRSLQNLSPQKRKVGSKYNDHGWRRSLARCEA
jgi:hypothetical protein